MFDFVFSAAARSNSNSWLFTILIYAVLIGGFFWWTSRRRKQMAEQQNKMKTGLVKGAHVVTIGGLHGIVDSVDDQRKIVTLDVEGVYLPFELRAIARIVPGDDLNAADKPSDDSSDKSDDSKTEDKSDN
ncbi:preprotein translocase subunit YajC [Oenococcus alcoholitolerans]|uniref:preprotein translocase subunit YajC n=1 Tax=Oenococcus alcoholitolerans TaxID=931074 RepID=UPI003F727E02